MSLTFKEACQIAEEAKDPTLAMLKDADECLQRMEPDVHGAIVAIHAARLAVALRLSEDRS